MRFLQQSMMRSHRPLVVKKQRRGRKPRKKLRRGKLPRLKRSVKQRRLQPRRLPISLPQIKQLPRSKLKNRRRLKLKPRKQQRKRRDKRRQRDKPS